MRMIRVSPPELARAFAGPYASISTTRCRRLARCHAVHAPNTPAPITATSNVFWLLTVSASYPNLHPNLKRFRQTACSDTIHRFVSFSSEVCVTVSRRAVLSLIVGLVSLFLTALPLPAQKTKTFEVAKPVDAPAAVNPVDPKTYGGMKWRLIGPFRGGRALAVTGVPSQPNTFYFGAVAGGVWKTTDAGNTWDPLFEKQTTSSIGAIAVSDSDPNVIYVGSGEACIRGNISFGDGVYRSNDGGKTWTNVGLKDSRHIGAVIVHPTNPDVAFVAALGHAYGANTERGIFRTRDGGKTWEKVLYLDDRTGGIEVVFDPQNPHVLFAAMWEGYRTPWTLNSGGDKDGLYRSNDDGTTWKRVEGNDGGATISVDGGKNWTTQGNQPTAQFYHVAADNDFQYRVYGSQQDNSSLGIRTRSDHGAIDRGDWDAVGGGESGYIVPDPRDSNIVYADDEGPIFTRFDRRTNQAQSIQQWPEDPNGHPAAIQKYRYTWTMPIVISSHNPDGIYHTSQYVFRSNDAGRTWSTISPDLTRNDKSKQQDSGGPLTKDQYTVEYYDVIFSLAESPKQQGLLWAGTDDGLIQLTRDGGKTWANVTPKEMPEWAMVSLIEASPFEAGTAYVAVDAHKLDNFKPYI